MARTSPPPLILGILAVLLTVATLGAIVLGVLVLYSSRQGAAIGPSGLAGALRRDKLDTALLLRDLAGMPDNEVLDYALTTGRTETAFAMVVFSGELTDSERASAFLSLARSYAGGKDPTKAVVCYQALISLASLSADFHDYQKANLLLQAGDGLAGLGRPLEAEESFDRVGEIARLSPYLQAAVRSQLLRTLAGKYAGLERMSKAVDATHAAQETTEASAGAPVIADLPARAPQWEGEPAWTEVRGRESERARAAIELITALEDKAAGQVEPRRLSLEEALLAEEQAQDVFYAGQVSVASGSSARLVLARHRVAWQTLKWRVAAGGFGLALVPSWERSLPDIERSLRAAQEDLYLIHLDLATLLPDPLAARQAAVDALVEELKLGRLGLYPGAPERGLAGDLTTAIGERVSQRRDDTMFVVPATRNGGAGIGFAFATADQLLRQ
jgi:hypothetical protein